MDELDPLVRAIDLIDRQRMLIDGAVHECALARAERDVLYRLLESYRSVETISISETVADISETVADTPLPEEKVLRRILPNRVCRDCPTVFTPVSYGARLCIECRLRLRQATAQRMRDTRMAKRENRR